MALKSFSCIVALVTVFIVALPGSAFAETVSITPPVELTDDAIPGQQMNPTTVVFEGVLYVFWASNSAETPIGSDFDITYSTYDGTEWSQNIVITANDTGNDHTPKPVIFRSSLYLLWSSTNPAITGSSDADIVVSTLSGNTWSAPLSVTSEFNSTGDYDPFPVVYGDELHIFFECFSPQSSHYEIGHALLSSTWGSPNYMTENSTGHNLNPTAAVAEQSLVLAWESSSSTLTGSADRAIISKVLTGSQWSGNVSASGEAGPLNIDPYILSYRGGAWLFWSTDSDVISQGDDFDIVCRVYGPDGWENTVTEIVAIPDSGNDTGPAATVHGDTLFLTWLSDSYDLDGESEMDTEVMMVINDSDGWSEPTTVSSHDGYRNDGGGATHRTVSMSSFDGRVMMIWETNASPLLTETTNTWLIFSECEFPEAGFNYYWLAAPLIITVAAVIYLGARKKS